MRSITKKHHIYYFSSIDYGFLLQRPQQIYLAMSKLDKDIAEAYYVEPIRTSFTWSKIVNGDKNILINGFHLPFNRYGMGFFEKIFNKITFRTLGIKKSKNHINVGILSNCYLEHYVPNDVFDIIAYDCLDAIEVHAAESDYDNYRRLHQVVLEKSDVIFVTADRLKEEIKSSSCDKKIITVSNGVNRQYFEQRKNSCNIKYNLPGKTKIVGYVGAIYDWIDLELVIETALRLPEYGFVMIGPVKESFAQLLEKKPDNMIFLGTQEYDTIPSHINKFDICLIPFKHSNISDCTDPIKLYEYFSLGKPVVATDMHQLRQYNDNRLLKIAVDSEQFAKAIEEFSLEDNDELTEARKRVAEDNSWERKAKIMIDAICQVAKIT